MQLYPGVAKLAVISSGPSGSGLILTSGASDAHGWWPTPLVVVGNDARSSTNLPAAVQAVTDRSNWIGWRTLDIWGGGDYSAATGALKVGNKFTFAGGAVVPSGVALEVQSGGQILVDSGGDIYCASGSKFINAPWFYQCNARFSGASALADALVVDVGTISITATAPGINDDPGGAGIVTAANTVKFWIHITTDGAGGFTEEDGYNLSGVTPTVVTSTTLAFTFQRPMANAYYAVTITNEAVSGGIAATATWSVLRSAKSTTGFTITVSTGNIATTVAALTVTVVGRSS